MLYAVSNLLPVISRWQPRAVVLLSDAAFNSKLPCWHGVKKNALQTSTPSNDVNGTVAASKTTDTPSRVTEERQRLRSGDGLSAVSTSRKKMCGILRKIFRLTRGRSALR